MHKSRYFGIFISENSSYPGESEESAIEAVTLGGALRNLMKRYGKEWILDRHLGEPEMISKGTMALYYDGDYFGVCEVL